ncbi:hypothetical protein ACQ4PT_063154 [Festuca glaucescens]
MFVKVEVALVVFLAHIGSFVPADSAVVGLTDRIFCAMGSKSMTTEQSTFMIDLHQVGTMLRHATSRSLCLLDEFGKGTLTEVIRHFDVIGYWTLEILITVLLSTHLTEIFTENYLPQSEHIKCYTMSVLNPDGQASNEDIIFLYRLVPGQALLSFGVPDEVIQRAASVLEDVHSRRPIRRMICDKLVAKDQQYQNVRARPRRIPAFGEWNYYDHGGYGYGYAGGDWPVTQYFESAMQAGGMVIALPASSPKPAKKAVTWGSATMEMADDEEQRRRQKVVVGLQEEHGTKKKADAGAPIMSSAKYLTRRVVKAVDEDLYVIPPDMLCHKPRSAYYSVLLQKRLPKSLWIGGCLGLSCVA